MEADRPTFIIRRNQKPGSQANRCLLWESIYFMRKRSVQNLKHLKNLNHLENHLTHQRSVERRAKRLYALAASLPLTLAVTVMPAFATGGSPLTAINKLSEFIFSLINAVGLILLGYGILQVGLSLQSHDPSQRSNGMLTIAGGVVIVFTKQILDLITA